MAGDPVVENATGYLMRNAQWLVQVIGVDGLADRRRQARAGVRARLPRPRRLPAEPAAAARRQPEHVFSLQRGLRRQPAVLLPHVKKGHQRTPIPARIGGNRDTLDFKLYFALKDNLEQHRRRRTPGSASRMPASTWPTTACTTARRA